jgi:hypothetical protein
MHHQDRKRRKINHKDTKTARREEDQEKKPPRHQDTKTPRHREEKNESQGHGDTGGKTSDTFCILGVLVSWWWIFLFSPYFLHSWSLSVLVVDFSVFSVFSAFLES